MKFLVVPDSFKGGVTSERFCDIFTSLAKGHETICFPGGDGGEGTIEKLTKITNGEFIDTIVLDGNFEPKSCAYGATADVAYVSISNSSGLPDTKEKNPEITTSFGFGEQILDAIKKGKKEIILCLGGSSTNDGGCGMLSALGAKFYDKEFNEFVPTGCNVGDVVAVNLKELNKNIKGIKFKALCDVKNPLIGPKGCSYTFAPQKGATTKEMQDELEKQMVHFAEFSKILDGNPNLEGAGAAGGLGFAIQTYLKGQLIHGATYFLDLIDFDAKAKTVDYVITGEGKFDATSLGGKICGTVIKRSEGVNKPVAVFCGAKGNTDMNVKTKVDVISINNPSMSLEENIKNGEKNLENAIREFLGKF